MIECMMRCMAVQGETDEASAQKAWNDVRKNLIDAKHDPAALPEKVRCEAMGVFWPLENGVPVSQGKLELPVYDWAAASQLKMGSDYKLTLEVV